MDYITKRAAIHMPHKRLENLFEIRNSFSLFVQDMHYAAYPARHKWISTVTVVPRGLDRFDSNEMGGLCWAWNTSISDVIYTTANAMNDIISAL